MHAWSKTSRFLLRNADTNMSRWKSAYIKDEERTDGGSFNKKREEAGCWSQKEESSRFEKIGLEMSQSDSQGLNVDRRTQIVDSKYRTCSRRTVQMRQHTLKKHQSDAVDSQATFAPKLVSSYTASEEHYFQKMNAMSVFDGTLYKERWPTFTYMASFLVNRPDSNFIITATTITRWGLSRMGFNKCSELSSRCTILRKTWQTISQKGSSAYNRRFNTAW